MGALPTTRPVTIDEFERMPDVDGIQELLDGEVVRVPPPKLRHSQILRQIAEILQAHVEKNRIWPETGFLIKRSCVQPDISVTHADQGQERGWFAKAPLVAIEVASRGNTPDELEFKKNLYLENGAAEVWIVYDRTRTVVMHTGHDAHSYDGEMSSRALDATFRVPEFFE